MLDAHIAVANVVQSFVGQLHSDIRVRKHGILAQNTSSSRAMCRPISSEAAVFRVSRNGKTSLSTPWSTSAAGNLILASGFSSPADIRHCMRKAAAAAGAAAVVAVVAVALLGKCSTRCNMLASHFLVPLSLSPFLSLILGGCSSGCAPHPPSALCRSKCRSVVDSDPP